MCKYCENKEDMGNKPIVTGYNMNVIIDGEFLYLYCNCGIHNVKEIKYCPMCGKKLKEGIF